MDQTSESVPMPDPTLRTNEQLSAAILALKELIFTVFTTRLDGMDKAVELLNENMTRVPTDTDKQIQQLKELQEEKLNATEKQLLQVVSYAKDIREEKFRSVELQFKERDVAVASALQAAKDAVAEQNRSSALSIAKSEAATIKQIDTLGVLLQTSIAGLDSKLNDVKDRLNKLEGEGAGKTTNQNLVGLMVGIFVGLGGLVIAAIAHFAK